MLIKTDLPVISVRITDSYSFFFKKNQHGLLELDSGPNRKINFRKKIEQNRSHRVI
jgi:hypothetical protein